MRGFGQNFVEGCEVERRLRRMQRDEAGAAVAERKRHIWRAARCGHRNLAFPKRGNRSVRQLPCATVAPFEAQPLRPLVAMPCTKKRWQNRYMMNTGIRLTTLAAMMSCQSLEYWPWNMRMPRGMVLLASLLK